MLNFILKKIIYGFLVLLGVIVVVFFLFNVLPGDAARMTQGQRSDVATLEAVKKEFGLDKPKYQQFLLYINDLSPISILKNDSATREKYHYKKLFAVSADKNIVLKSPYLRRSYQTKKLVTEILWDTIPNTALLAITAMIFATIIGIVLGIFAAIYKDTWIDKVALSSAILGISMPSFFAGIIIAWIFGFLLSPYTGLNLSGSLYDYDPFKGEVIQLHNLVLPMLTLGIRPLSIIVQLTRSSMLEVLSMDYIRTAKAKGLSNYKVIVKHALRNALNPVVTAVSGWFASLMAGAFFVEYIFAWNGLGKVTVDALELSDFPVVMGAVLFIALLFVLINIFVDILYGVLDPRVRLS
jgi:peptide/nickel transport system permease protein